MKFDIINEVKGFWNDILTFFLLPECFVCGRKLASYREVICDDCRERLERNSAPFCLICRRTIKDARMVCCEDSPVDFVFAVGNYKDGWGDLVEAYKLQRKVALSRFFALELAAVVKQSEFFRDFYFILPVPTSPVKLRERGYSQTLLIAKMLADETGLKLIDNGAKRVKFRRSQIGLGADERRENVKGTFAIVEKNIPQQGNIIIVDDVVTTGSTLMEFGSVLKKYVKGRISALVVARA